jgi:hypothetical protein
MQKDGTEAPAGKMPYEAALTEVVKGLHQDPVLLFGIGAGIVIVAALAFTSSLALVVVVAALFVVVLAARAHQRTQRVRHATDVKGRAFASSLEDSDVATAPEGIAARVRGLVAFSRVKNSRVGAVGGRKRRRPPGG